VPSILVSTALTSGIAINRIRRYYHGAYPRQIPPPTTAYLALLAYDVGQDVVTGVLEEHYQDTLVPPVADYLPELSAVRLVQALFVGLAKCLLNPLELTFKRQILSVRSMSLVLRVVLLFSLLAPPSALSYYKGAFPYAFLESFCEIFLSHKIYAAVNSIFS
jgi:hypothetical protein